MFDQRLEKYFTTYKSEAEGYTLADALQLAQAGELMKAASCMKLLLAPEPDSLDILYNYGKICYAIYNNKGEEQELKKDFKDVSRMLFEMCMEKYPDFSGSYYYLGYFYLNAGLYEKASLIWGKYLEMASPQEDMEAEEIREQMVLLSELVKFERGYLAVLAGRPDEGLALLEPLLKKDESAWNIMYFTGLAYRQKGDFDKAAGLFLKVLAKRPSQSEAMNELGLCYAAQNNFVKAEKYFKKALLIKENDPEILCNLAGLYIQAGKLLEGEAFLKQAREIAPEDEIGKSWQQELARQRKKSRG